MKAALCPRSGQEPEPGLPGDGGRGRDRREPIASSFYCPGPALQFQVVLISSFLPHLVGKGLEALQPHAAGRGGGREEAGRRGGSRQGFTAWPPAGPRAVLASWRSSVPQIFAEGFKSLLPPTSHSPCQSPHQPFPADTAESEARPPPHGSL